MGKTFSTRAAIVLLVVQTTTACVTASGGLAVSNVPVDGRPYTVIGPGEATLYWWSFDSGLFSSPFGPPPIARAIDTVMARQKGEALLNIRYSVDRFLLPLFTLHRLHMRADVIRFGSPTDESKR